MNDQNCHSIFIDKSEKQWGFNYLLKDRTGLLIPVPVHCLSGFVACNIYMTASVFYLMMSGFCHHGWGIGLTNFLTWKAGVSERVSLFFEGLRWEICFKHASKYKLAFLKGKREQSPFPSISLQQFAPKKMGVVFIIALWHCDDIYGNSLKF